MITQEMPSCYIRTKTEGAIVMMILPGTFEVDTNNIVVYIDKGWSYD